MAGSMPVAIRRLTESAGSAGVACNARRFVLASLAGLAVDLGIFHILSSGGARLSTAHIASFFIAGIVNYPLYGRWAFRQTTEQRFSGATVTGFMALGLMALFLRGGVLTLFMQQFRWPANAALIAAIAVTALINYLGCAFFVFPQRTQRTSVIHWRITTLCLIGYSLLLRLVYLGLPTLLPQEAYYWNYAQHPALGYLDHPPMVAWLITAGIAVFGHSEFGVRLGVFLTWFVTAGFCFGLARNTFDKKTALQTVLFVSLLPLFFFVAGFFTTPDAPLIAAWAGALFFLERALLALRRLAWWGVGACFGLGMCSKYTIALLGVAVLVFVLLDKRSRHWLLRPEPYAALLLALLIFIPVILWNAENGWASFLFQSVRRFGAAPRFSIQVLLGSVLILFTPLGAIGVVQSLLNKRIWSSDGSASGASALRKRFFSLVFALVPFALLALFSLKHQPKLNWTCPLWLAIMPALAKLSLRDERAAGFHRETLWQRVSIPLLVVSACVYGGVLHYVSIGLPGIPYPKYSAASVAWSEIGKKVEHIENMVESETGKEPLVVGMDKGFIASELAFYRSHSRQGKGRVLEDTCSVNLFNEEGLMYGWWYPREHQIGKTCIIVGIKPDKISNDELARYFHDLGPIEEVCVTKDDILGGCFYYRVAKGYIGAN